MIAPSDSGLYRLPWTATNNPSGWVEVTTHCQLRCPGCYRGIGETGWRPRHRPIEEVRAEIDTLIRERNIQTVNFAGGEPLLYPWLEDAVAHARGRGLEVVILTNGVALDEARLIRLRDAGTSRILVHLEKVQDRVHPATEEAVNGLRSEYCDMFRRVKGVALGFMFSVSPENAADLPAVIEFYKQNADVVRVAGFTVRADARPGHDMREGRLCESYELAARIRDLYGLEYGAYLPRTGSPTPAWLFAFGFVRGGRSVAWMDADACRQAQEAHLRQTGRYFILSDRIRGWRRLPALARNASVRRLIAAAGLDLFRGRVHSQTVFLVNTPVQRAGGTWDFCDGCPDAMLWQGCLIPSCLLERAKAGEGVPVLWRQAAVGPKGARRRSQVFDPAEEGSLL